MSTSNYIKEQVCGTEYNNFHRVWCRCEETESLTESCSDTRSKRGSEDRVSETESVSDEFVNSQKPAKKFRSDICDYFEKNASGDKVWCQLWEHEYAYLGTTSNLRDHLICYHKDKYKWSDTIESGDEQQTSHLDILLIVTSVHQHVPKR